MEAQSTMRVPNMDIQLPMIPKTYVNFITLHTL